MYLNQFEKSNIARLDQILHTLETVHGIKLSFDWTSPSVTKDLLETKQTYERTKAKIVHESGFNSYQQNPEYTKSMLILEAVKIMLTEIAPKRRRVKKVKESLEGINEDLVDTLGSASHEVRIYRDGRANNYKVQVFKNKKHDPKLDGVADTEEEAREVANDRLGKKTESLTIMQAHVGHTKSQPGMDNVHEAGMNEEISENKGQHMTVNRTRILENALHQQHDYEYQASMARSELYRNAKYAMSMLKQVDPQSEVPPWIAGALTKAANYLDKVFHYLDYYKKFEPEKLPENMEGMEGDLELGETSGSVTRENLMLVVEYSIKLFNMIQPGEKLEGWVAMKLTTASESVSSCKHYLDYVQFEKHGLDSHFDEGRRAIKRKMDESTLLEAETAEDLQRAQTIITAKEMSDEVQKIAEKAAQLGVERLMPLVDSMRAQFGVDVANGYNDVVKSALDELLSTATKSKESIDTAIATLQNGGVPGASTDIENAGTPSEEPGATDTGEPPPVAPVGEPEEPLGRAKKKVSETKDVKLKCKSCGKQFTPSYGEYSRCPDCLEKQLTAGEIATKVQEATTLKEKSPPGKKAEKWIKSNKKRFIDQYGKKKGMSVLYAKAWDMFGESSDAYNNAKSLIETKKKMLDNLENQFVVHKAKFAEGVLNGQAKDPLSIGYGLEGELIVQKINTISKELNEATSVMTYEMKKGINALLEQLKNISKADNISKVKDVTPYGVIYTRGGKLSKKMFESVETREYWLGLNSDEIANVKMIEPETFDKAINSVLKGN